MVEDGGSVDGGHDGCLDRADEKPDDTPMALRPGSFRARFRVRFGPVSAAARTRRRAADSPVLPIQEQEAY
ncbi:hypothetical protein F3J14_10275 [Burkholderia sp. Tr-862]|nr:hypothetical protein [Burkholderia sp. Tr-862]